ncbi:MAG: hypothetical protein ACKN9F_11185, partial [Methylomonas sp.]
CRVVFRLIALNRLKPLSILQLLNNSSKLVEDKLPSAAPSTEAFAGNSPFGSPHGCGELAKGQEAPFANPQQKLRCAGCKRRSGGLSFGYFSLAMQRKVTRLSVREPTLKQLRNAKLYQFLK